MHPFVRSILLRTPRANRRVQSTELHPPDVEIREAVNRLSRERHAIVRANGDGQAVFAERPLKHGTRRDSLRRQPPAAGEQIPRVLIGDRERKTVQPIAGAELAFEVCGPEVVRHRRRGADHAGMLRLAAPRAMMDEASPRQQIGNRTRRRPRVNLAMFAAQHAQELLRAPPRMLHARRDQQLANPRVRSMGAVLRCATAVRQPASPVGFISSEPLVTDAAADAVARTQLAHREPITLGIANEPETFFHGNTLLPGHHGLARSSDVMQVSESVTYVPGSKSYPCTRIIPSCGLTGVAAGGGA